MNKINKLLSNRLKELREHAGLNENEMAEKIGISYSAYSKYESGISDLPVYLLVRIADTFNVSTDYLLGRQSARLNDDQLKTAGTNLCDLVLETNNMFML